MRTFFISGFFIVLLGLTGRNPGRIFSGIFDSQANKEAVIEFETLVFDFGNISEGTTATHDFRFKNTGNAILLINRVIPSCSCTAPDWSREPVLPGKYGKISASFKSSGTKGSFVKTITVESNAKDRRTVLMIKGFVK